MDTIEPISAGRSRIWSGNNRLSFASYAFLHMGWFTNRSYEALRKKLLSMSTKASPTAPGRKWYRAMNTTA